MVWTYRPPGEMVVSAFRVCLHSHLVQTPTLLEPRVSFSNVRKYKHEPLPQGVSLISAATSWRRVGPPSGSTTQVTVSIRVRSLELFWKGLELGPTVKIRKSNIMESWLDRGEPLHWSLTNIKHPACFSIENEKTGPSEPKLYVPFRL